LVCTRRHSIDGKKAYPGMVASLEYNIVGTLTKESQ
jgi:hypothetical protein